MHPAHVASFVVGEVEELRARIDVSKLPVHAVELENETSLYLTLDLLQRARHSTRDASGALPVGAGLLGPGGRTIENVPDLSVRPEPVRRILLFDLEDFDSQPPTAELLDADRTPLARQFWPRDLANGGIVDSHEQWPRPWFCRPGLREFHTHPEHEDVPWDQIRGAPLHGIVLGLVSDVAHRFVI
jgi:hypothetical protein